jgi:hypothetical protein
VVRGCRLKRFILKRDAQIINLACEGLGTDDDLLTKVLSERNKAQLQVVKQDYREKYNKTLEVSFSFPSFFSLFLSCYCLRFWLGYAEVPDPLVTRVRA